MKDKERGSVQGQRGVKGKGVCRRKKKVMKRSVIWVGRRGGYTGEIESYC